MNRLKIIFTIALAVALGFVAACASLRTTSVQSCVIEAEYHRVTFITVLFEDGAHAQPYHDYWIIVTETIEGNFPSLSVLAVHPNSPPNPNYPKDMEEGKTYTLKFTPSKNTLFQMQRIKTKEVSSGLLIIGEKELQFHLKKKK